MRLFLALFWTILISLLCFTPGQALPDLSIFSYDKLGHFALFAGFVVLWGRAFQGMSSIHQPIQRALLMAIGFSALIEIVQHFLIPNRSGEWADFLADVIGCGIGLVYLWLSPGGKKKEDLDSQGQL
ncbi:MAG: VanZ family protein [Bacteroidota bacterium]